MTAKPAPRSINSRIKWFLNTEPLAPGMCANHTWRSLGGDKGNPPKWNCKSANEVYAKVLKSGRYFKSWPAPEGALLLYKYGVNGHMCLAYKPNLIVTTDPHQGNGTVGIEAVSYPNKWGASGPTIWTDTYNGVRFDVGIDAGPVDLSKLKYGTRNSYSVSRLQRALTLKGFPVLITGNYLDVTDKAVRNCQKAHKLGNDKARKSFVGIKQATFLFKDLGDIVHE